MPRMNLKQMEHMLALAASGSFSRAASQCCLTQPALSRSVQALEDELGARLFDRAIMHARIKRVVFGARDAKTGACGSVVDLFAEGKLNHHTQVLPSVRSEECVSLLKQFFRERRLQKKAS